MPEMSLLEALQTDEVKGMFSTLVQEAVDAALPDAVEAALTEKLPEIQESVRGDLRQDNHLRSLHGDAVRLIQESKLTDALKDHLLDDYRLVEAADGTEPVMGRSLRTVEAVVDAAGKVVKSASDVLRESVEADIKRFRDVLGEARPTLPSSGPSGEGGHQVVETADEDGAEPAWAKRIRESGGDPELFGLPKPEPTPAPAA